jgi:hypothetical protein
MRRWFITAVRSPCEVAREFPKGRFQLPDGFEKSANLSVLAGHDVAEAIDGVVLKCQTAFQRLQAPCHFLRSHPVNPLKDAASLSFVLGIHHNDPNLMESTNTEPRMTDQTDNRGSADIEMDASNLYVEETFTDNRVGTIRRMSPVTPNGEADASRSVRFLGSAQIMTPAGALPLTFEIPAENLVEATAAFGGAARKAVESTMEELRELQRQQASSIVVPGSGAGPQGGFPPGAGGGGIQMP